MAKINLTCPDCGHSFECPARYRGRQISCPECQHLVPLPRDNKARKLFIGLIGLASVVVLIIVAVAWLVWPGGVHWPDRRPIGVLFLASTYHASATNPRGWFNDDKLDVTGPGGNERFRKALLDYADTSVSNLTRLGAQGVIVWDVEGEEYPHKTSFIGDPRLLDQLAPEMAAAADEFFKKFRDAGLKVGVTIRPQQLVFENGLPRQSTVLDIKRVLLEKIDYAKARWGCTIFYLDSNDGFWRPDEMWQLRRLTEQRPGILLIPEHHYLPYWAFSVPYVSLRKGNVDPGAGLARKWFPGSFQVLDIADATEDQVAATLHAGDVPLFRAWYWNSDCELLEKFQHQKQ